MSDKAHTADEAEILTGLEQVRGIMAGTLMATPLKQVLSGFSGLLGAGKMLRARITLRLGKTLEVPLETQLHAAAAVEMIHAASLLHDDVIDGGYIRRGLPTFWVEKGVSGAILLGDLLLFKAVDLVCRVDGGKLAHPLVLATGEICEAETEQEIVLRGVKANWDQCVSISRRKTGALFAFAALACGGRDPKLTAALQEAGYLVGTAYQLADDILDKVGTEEHAGKTLGTDQLRQKTTALRVDSTGINPVTFIEDLIKKSSELLAPWPHAVQGWEKFIREDFHPSIGKILACYSQQTPA